MTSAQGALEGVAHMDGVMIPLHIMVLRWKGPIKGPIHSSTNLAQEVLRVVLKECMKIGILAGEDPQMSPHKEGALKSHLVRSVFYIIDTEISSRKKDYVKMIRKMH